MNFSNAQLQQLWLNAGGDPTQANTMAAIALAESSGNPADVNSNASEGATGSWGLWQINGDAHPQFDHQSLLSPQYNAAAAVAVYQSQGLGAWSTYKNGAYAKYLTGANGSGAPSSSSSTTSVYTQVVQTSLNPLVLLNSWITGPTDVLYKTFALCAVLIVLGAIKQTQQYAGWAALCILFVLMIQQQPKAAAAASTGWTDAPSIL